MLVKSAVSFVKSLADMKSKNLRVTAPDQNKCSHSPATNSAILYSPLLPGGIRCSERMQRANGPFTEYMFMLQKQMHGAQQKIQQKVHLNGILTPIDHC